VPACKPKRAARPSQNANGGLAQRPGSEKEVKKTRLTNAASSGKIFFVTSVAVRASGVKLASVN
jgi:hypothetical protein